MFTEQNVNRGLNLTLHVFILFTFLTVFFFVYISKLEKQSIKDTLNHVIKNETYRTFDKLDYYSKKMDLFNIDWKNVNKLAKDMVDQSQGELPSITKTNNNVFKLGVGMIIGIFILFIGAVLYFKFFTKHNINIGHIIVENAVIFAFIGAIEFLFFKYIASKYVPVTPDFMTKSVLERIKYRVNKELQ